MDNFDLFQLILKIFRLKHKKEIIHEFSKIRVYIYIFFNLYIRNINIEVISL